MGPGGAGRRGEGGLDRLLEQLARLCAAVERQVRANPAFAQELGEILAPAPPSEPARRPPAFNPFAIYEKGWEAMLRSRLTGLSQEQLADIIHAHELDPTARTRGKSAEKLREWIVAQVMERADRSL